MRFRCPRVWPSGFWGGWQEARQQEPASGLPAEASPRAPVAGSPAVVGPAVSPLRRRVPYRVRWMVGLAGRSGRGAACGRLAAIESSGGCYALGRAGSGHAAFRRRIPRRRHLLAETPPPEDYPLGHDVLEVPGTHWRWVAGFLGGKAVAYDLPGPGGGRATLYVARRVVEQLPSLPPDVPQPMTAGCSAAAWQQEALLYVLVVEGDARAYRGFLDRTRGPLT